MPARGAPAAPFKWKWIVGAALGVGVVVGSFYLGSTRSDRPNLLLITIDTLRADHVGAWGHAGAHTPSLDGLAARGARFANAEAAVPLTGPSHATIFTGSYPPVHGVRDNVTFVLDPRHVTLATLLKRRGYRTAAFVGAYPVAAAFGLSQGFDEYHEGFHQVPIPGQGAERPGNEVADETIAWLAKAQEPFFVWAHFYDPHAPYTPPSPYREDFKDRPYDGEIAFADAQVGRILDALKAAGREEDTLVVATSDHGEALGEHDELTHAILIYEATLHVPLILAGPGVPRGLVVSDRVGSVDVLPTVLRLLGAPGIDGLRGRDLRAAWDGRRVPPEGLYSESLFGRLNCRWSALRGWTLGDWKLVQGTEPELFNLAEDPREMRNIARVEPTRVARMSAALQAACAKMAPAGDSAHPAAISPEQEERLRSLGYTSGSGGGGAIDQPGLPDPRTLVRLYERIQSLVGARGGALEAALSEMAHIAESDPGNPYAQYSLGSMAYHAGRLTLAEKAYARALELDPDRPGMRLGYGRLLRDMGRLEEAERQLRIAAEQTTADDVRTRMALADTLLLRGRIDEAGKLIDAALAAEPNHVDALRSNGRLLAARGRAAEGIALLERAAGLDPESWIEIARGRLDLGDPSGALAAAEKALSANPGHPWALAVRGQALIAAGRRDEGLDSLRRALAAGPRRPEVWLTLARAFESAGARSSAAECRRQAERISHG